MITLRPYQQEAIAAIEGAGIQRPLLVLPTGCGKTVVFCHLIERRPGRSLILAHRDELIEQPLEKLGQIAPELDVGVVKAERDEHDAPVVLASVQTLANRRRLERLAQTPFRTIVVDEAHHVLAKSYVDVLEALGAFTGRRWPLTVGVTATAERGDQGKLGRVWERIVYERGLLEMIQAGYLSDLRGVRIALAADLDRVKVSHGDFSGDGLASALRDADAPRHGVAAWREHAADRPTLLFTPTVPLAEEFAEEFRGAGVTARMLCGRTPSDERRAALAAFRRGELQVITNAALLTEGVDLPMTSCIVLARPTKSRPLFKQMIGRGTRIWPGKDDCLVLDLVGATTKHDLASLPELAGLPGDADLEGATLAQRAAQAAAGAGAPAQGVQQELEDQQGQLLARVVDLFGRKRMHWARARGRQGQLLALSAGDETVILVPTEGERFDVLRAVRGERGATPLAEGLELGYATGVAEDHIRSLGAGSLIDPNASWRRKRASAKQLEALERWGIVPSADMRAGDASDLLSAAVAESRVACRR